jgi:hypothetical protein
MAVRTIEHKIAAGSQFDGQVPTTTKVIEKDMERFPEDSQGGLFDFEFTRPFSLVQLVIKFGGQSSWSINLVDTDGTEVELVSGTTETEFITTQEVGALAGLILLEDHKLKLVTTGASTAMVARCSVDQLRS